MPVGVEIFVFPRPTAARCRRQYFLMFCCISMGIVLDQRSEKGRKERELGGTHSFTL